MKTTTNITLDFSGDIKNQNVTAKQGDKKTRCINIKLLQNGIPISLSESETVDIRLTKPDNTSVVAPCVKNPDGTITAELPEQALSAIGNVLADIAISGADGDVLSSTAFYINVKRSAGSEGYIPSIDYFKRLSDIDMNGHKIKSLAVPTDGSDAATKDYVDCEIANAKKRSEYRLIADITLEEAINQVMLTQDTDGNLLALKKVFAVFEGAFTETAASGAKARFHLRFNGGQSYQCYKEMPITAGTDYFFWIESQRMGSKELGYFKSTFPEEFIENGTLQGLTPEIKNLYSDISKVRKNFGVINTINFGFIASSSNMLEKGSKITMWGVDDDE